MHVAVDDHRRLAYVEILADQRGTACAAFLRRALAWFGARGIRCQLVLSDNGSGYVSRGWASARQSRLSAAARPVAESCLMNNVFDSDSEGVTRV